MTFVQLNDEKNIVFALDPTNIKEVNSFSPGFRGKTRIVTYNDEVFYCNYEFNHVLTLINNALENREQRVINTHRFPSCGISR